MPTPSRRSGKRTRPARSRAIFADLRATLGVPFVNLIWRHLATIPGGLVWTWELLKPLYESAELDRAASALLSGVALPDLEALPDAVWDCAGVSRQDRAAIATLIAEYNRGNSVNFLALHVAASVLRGERTGAGVAVPTHRAAASRPAAVGAPRLLGLSELSPPVLKLVQDLDQFGRLGPSDAIASLYRHLAHWPPALALAYTALLPHHRSGGLARAQEGVIAAGREQIGALSRLVSAGPPPPDDAGARILAAVDEFTRLMIGRMVVMGAALDTIVGHPGGPG